MAKLLSISLFSLFIFGCGKSDNTNTQSKNDEITTEQEKTKEEPQLNQSEGSGQDTGEKSTEPKRKRASEVALEHYNKVLEMENKNAENQSAKIRTVEIQCSGMTCTGCENSIKSKVKKLGGVKEVIADFKTNTVKATFDGKQTNVEAIKSAITDAGYDVVSVK
ncbi:MAG: cation transporter [Chlorobi bacterium]|nr:cation transporter [Chlorobiota bacterium]MCI0714735.1 cation transporter [Chlorobiota bacterium]